MQYGSVSEEIHVIVTHNVRCRSYILEKCKLHHFSSASKILKFCIGITLYYSKLQESVLLQRINFEKNWISGSNFLQRLAGYIVSIMWYEINLLSVSNEDTDVESNAGGPCVWCAVSCEAKGKRNMWKSRRQLWLN